MKRGEIYYVEPSKQYQETGSEQRTNRPAIIVSNDLNNENAQTVEVVYLTTQPKKELPTHVQINCNGRISTVLCEQISTVAVERLQNYMGTCTDDEMCKINNAIIISLGINETENNQSEPLQEEIEACKAANLELTGMLDRSKIQIETYAEIIKQFINGLAKN